MCKQTLEAFEYLIQSAFKLRLLIGQVIRGHTVVSYKIKRISLKWEESCLFWLKTRLKEQGWLQASLILMKTCPLIGLGLNCHEHVWKAFWCLNFSKDCLTSTLQKKFLNYAWQSLDRYHVDMSIDQIMRSRSSILRPVYGRIIIKLHRFPSNQLTKAFCTKYTIPYCFKTEVFLRYFSK